MLKESNNCKIVYNLIRDTVAPFLATVTIGLYGYKANNSIRVYMVSGGSADSYTSTDKTRTGRGDSLDRKDSFGRPDSLDRQVISGTQKELQVRSLEGACCAVLNTYSD
jgi:hypothetical protein